VLPQGASRVLLLRSDERHSIPQLSSPRFGQPASLAWRLFEVQRFWRSLAHADLSVLTRENRGGKPDFQLRVAPAWSHFLVHHHLSREWFWRYREVPPSVNTACPWGKPAFFPWMRALLLRAEHYTPHHSLPLSRQLPNRSQCPFDLGFSSLPARWLMRGKPRRKSIKPHDPRSPVRNDAFPERFVSKPLFLNLATESQRYFVTGIIPSWFRTFRSFVENGIWSRRRAWDPEVHYRRWIKHARRGHLSSSLSKRPSSGARRHWARTFPSTSTAEAGLVLNQRINGDWVFPVEGRPGLELYSQ